MIYDSMRAARIVRWCSCSPALPRREAAEPPALARARTLYNAGDYDGAIDAAAVRPATAGGGGCRALVIARAHLERYRLDADADDLAAAREALGAIGLRPDAARSGGPARRPGADAVPRRTFGAAAEVFDTALGRARVLHAPRPA